MEADLRLHRRVLRLTRRLPEEADQELRIGSAAGGTCPTGELRGGTHDDRRRPYSPAGAQNRRSCMILRRSSEFSFDPAQPRVAETHPHR